MGLPEAFAARCLAVFFRSAERTWNHLPASILQARWIRSCGDILHDLVGRWDRRRMFVGTFFMRNRPQLELIRRLACRADTAFPLIISVLGCSTGAEAYSILATIKTARPRLRVIMHAVDISLETLAVGRKGAYSLTGADGAVDSIFERLTDSEIHEFFDRDGNTVTVKSWLKEGIIWHLADARDPELLDVLGHQDIVVANNFICHMEPPDDERCLRQIARLVKPGGYLVVSGLDIGVRTKVASDLRWIPVMDLLEDIHDGDPVMRQDWPWRYWGLEPLDKTRTNWALRYATVFKLDEFAAA